jgi:hypothetical protein
MIFQDILQQPFPRRSRQVFQAQYTAVRSALAPDHLFKVLIRRDDDSFLVHGPSQELLVTHPGIALIDAGNIVAHLHQPLA